MTKIRYRITFEKKGTARFVGHLDLQTLFQRALKRAGLPVAYSQGFNPHMLISFAQPLPLGFDSLCEMVDVETTHEIEPPEIISKLNQTLPAGFVVTNAEYLPPGAKRVAAAVYAASYAVKLTNPLLSVIPLALEKLPNTEQHAVMRDKIITISFDAPTETLHLKLRAGGEKNLKPAVVIAAICELAEIELTPSLAHYTRTEIILANTSVNGG